MVYKFFNKTSFSSNTSVNGVKNEIMLDQELPE